MSNFREIVTKAVIGKAKKTLNGKYEISPDEVPSTVLGCWIINHQFNGVNNNGNVSVNGSFDVNVWYSHDSDTKTSVVTRSFNYSDKLNIPLKNTFALDNTSEIIVHSLRQPTVTNVKIDNGIIKLDVEKELGVEVVGNTKVKISVEDDYDDYEELIDDELEQELDNIKEDYLEDKEA